MCLPTTITSTRYYYDHVHDVHVLWIHVVVVVVVVIAARMTLASRVDGSTYNVHRLEEVVVVVGILLLCDFQSHQDGLSHGRMYDPVRVVVVVTISISIIGRHHQQLIGMYGYSVDAPSLVFVVVVVVVVVVG